MDRRQLTSFVALADDLHFSKTAMRLNITQPALSQQIARLEAELNVQLFSRDPKHVALTDAGRVFLEEAQRDLTSHGSRCDNGPARSGRTDRPAVRRVRRSGRHSAFCPS